MFFYFLHIVPHCRKCWLFVLRNSFSLSSFTLPTPSLPVPHRPSPSQSLPACASPDLEWLWNQDASRDLLLAVHPPNYIVLWNGDTGTKLWKKSYAENILSFSFDPFDPSNMARTCPHSSPPRAPRSANSTRRLRKPEFKWKRILFQIQLLKLNL